MTVMKRSAFLKAILGVVVWGALAPSVQAGGFFAFAALPKPDTASESEFAVVVSVVGCHADSIVRVSATIETMTEGKGGKEGKVRTISVAVVPLGGNRFGIRRTWPQEVRQVLSFVALSKDKVTLPGKAPISLRAEVLVPLNEYGLPMIAKPKGVGGELLIEQVRPGLVTRAKLLKQLFG